MAVAPLFGDALGLAALKLLADRVAGQAGARRNPAVALSRLASVDGLLHTHSGNIPVRNRLTSFLKCPSGSPYSSQRGSKTLQFSDLQGQGIWRSTPGQRRGIKREGQGNDTGQGGTPLSGREADILVCQGTLPGSGQELEPIVAAAGVVQPEVVPGVSSPFTQWLVAPTDPTNLTYVSGRARGSPEIGQKGVL